MCPVRVEEGFSEIRILGILPIAGFFPWVTWLLYMGHNKGIRFDYYINLQRFLTKDSQELGLHQYHIDSDYSWLNVRFDFLKKEEPLVEKKSWLLYYSDLRNLLQHVL